MADRYTAEIKVEHIQTTPAPAGRGLNIPPVQKKSFFRIVVGAPTLEGLKTKIEAHTSLIDGDDFDDEVTR